MGWLASAPEMASHVFLCAREPWSSSCSHVGPHPSSLSCGRLSMWSPHSLCDLHQAVFTAPCGEVELSSFSLCQARGVACVPCQIQTSVGGSHVPPSSVFLKVGLYLRPWYLSEVSLTLITRSWDLQVLGFFLINFPLQKPRWGSEKHKNLLKGGKKVLWKYSLHVLLLILGILYESPPTPSPWIHDSELWPEVSGYLSLWQTWIFSQ